MTQQNSQMFSEPWATTPECLSELIALTEKSVDIDAVLAKRGKPLNDTVLTEVRGGTAIIPIVGPIFKTETMLSYVLGLTTIDRLAEEFHAALNDTSVRNIVLNIHSPGGQVFGVGELADMIYAGRGKKQITAYVSGMAASAAYWLASAADEIVMDATSMAGSLGVVFSYPRQSKDAPIEIVSTLSPLKRVDPSTDEGRAQVLRQADAIANVFVNAVARNRGMARERVITDFGRGGMLVGAEAVEAGLADKLGSLEAIISRNTYSIGGKPMSDKSQAAEIKQTANIENVEQLAAEYPDLVAGVREEARRAVDTESVAKEAREAESARILALAGIQFGEEESKRLEAVVKSGVTVEQFQAVLGAMPKATAGNAEAELAALKAKQLADIQAAGATNPGHQSKTETGDFMAQVKEYQKQHGGSLADAMKNVVKNNPEAHAAYIRQAQVH